MRLRLQKFFLDYFIIFLGAFLFSFSFNLFIRNAQIAVGGITGISMIINHFFPRLSMGLLTLLVNIPFLILGLLRIGGRFMAKTVFASIALSLFMQLTENITPLTSDPLLCSIYGGIGTGIGLGLVFTKNASTAGSDIIGIVLRQKYTGISLGKLILAADTVIVLCVAASFQNINSALYSIIQMYIASIATDGVIYGFTTDKLAFIISEKAKEISVLVMSELHHGATIITGEGARESATRKILMCAINTNQIGKLKELVRESDNEAFVIVTNTHEVLGSGFRPNIKTNI